MRIDMTKKITIEKNENTNSNKNSYGEVNDNWITVNTLYASKEPILGNEYFSAMMVQSKVEVKYRMHFTNGITNDMRIIDDEGIYQILSVINVKSQNRELLVYCKRVG